MFKRQCGYLFALIFLISSIVLGVWSSNILSPLLQRDKQIVATHVGATAGQGQALSTVRNCFSGPCLTITPRPSVQSVSTPTAWPSLDMNAGVRLLIPAIGIDAPIEPVGVLPNGALNVPEKNRWTGVGWYKDGPIPGLPGSAIIDGHLDRPGGIPAVFWNLNQLRIGDIVAVVAVRGQMLSFRVVQLQAYRPGAAPLDKIFGDSSGTYLNLITCAGQWVQTERQTTLRLVVYTKMV